MSFYRGCGKELKAWCGGQSEHDNNCYERKNEAEGAGETRDFWTDQVGLAVYKFYSGGDKFNNCIYKLYLFIKDMNKLPLWYRES